MKNVFVIQNSPSKNFEPAKKYGELTIMLRGNESIEDAERFLSNYLQEFEPTDYLLLVGSPVFIVIATIIAWQNLPSDKPLNLLVWNKEHYQYDCKQIDIP